MSELLILRLALVAVIFIFVFAAGATMRNGVRTRTVRLAAPVRNSHAGPRFVVTVPGDTGLTLGTEFAVAGEMLIGREGSSGVILPDPSVSARHATISRSGGVWLLRDVGSTNGTLVNGRPVGQKGVPLRGGEDLTFGSVGVRFQA
jgi:hypothetical protein